MTGSANLMRSLSAEDDSLSAGEDSLSAGEDFLSAGAVSEVAFSGSMGVRAASVRASSCSFFRSLRTIDRPEDDQPIEYGFIFQGGMASAPASSAPCTHIQSTRS